MAAGRRSHPFCAPVYPQLGDPAQQPRKPPAPFTSYAIMLSDIITDSPRKKMNAFLLSEFIFWPNILLTFLFFLSWGKIREVSFKVFGFYHDRRRTLLPAVFD